MTDAADSQPAFAIRSSRVVTPHGVRDAVVIVQGEKVTGVTASHDVPSGLVVNDVGDLVVSPGLIDAHVHVNEPGRTEWEGFATATLAAVAGGITTIVDMPLNSSPVTTCTAAFHAKLGAAASKCQCDVGFYGGLVPGNGQDVGPLLDAGALGIKAFLCPSGLDEFPAATESDLRQAMPVIAARNAPLLVHCELPVAAAPAQTDPKSYRQYCNSRPDQWEVDAIRLMIDLCREYGCRVHIVHLSSTKALDIIVAAKEEGLPLTVETCPHYLVFSAASIADGDTRFKCAPPIRSDENRQRLWHAVRAGTIDTIGSDHSPCPPAMKHLETGDFIAAWGGIASLQWLLSSVWTEACGRGCTLTDLAKWFGQSPSELLGLAATKGRIQEGFDADLVLWNPEESFVVESSTILHRHRVTPYLGRELKGRVHQTYLRGHLVYDRGRSTDKPAGRFIMRSAESTSHD